MAGRPDDPNASTPAQQPAAAPPSNAEAAPIPDAPPATGEPAGSAAASSAPAMGSAEGSGVAREAGAANAGEAAAIAADATDATATDAMAESAESADGPESAEAAAMAQGADSDLLTQEELDAVLAAAGLATGGYEASMGDAGAADSAAAGVEAHDAAMPFVPPEMGGRGAAAREAEAREIELISDVALDVQVELGRTHMLIEDVLRLGPGSVVELDKLAGDPVDIYVNDRLVARGEVLVLNDDFCVRISEVITPGEEVAAA